MSKKIKITAAWVMIIITLVFSLAGGVGNWFKQEAAVAGMTTKQAEIKAEGCLPARANGNSIGKVETRLESIDERLTSITTQQTAGFEAVMKKLDEK